MVKGLNVQACVSCGAYTLDQLTLERLLGGPSSHWGATPEPGVYLGTPPGGSPVYTGAPTIPAPPPSPPAILGELPPPMTGQQVPTFRPTPLPPLRQELFDPGPPPEAQLALEQAARQSQTRMVLAIGVFLALGVAMLLVSLFVLQGITSLVQPAGGHTETVPSAELNEVFSDDPKAAANGGQVTAEPPAPEPEPEPEPEPPRPRVDPVAASLAAGWNSVDSNPSGALASFRRVLDVNPGHAEANYGVGYAMIKLGDPAGARPFLCTALAGAGVETRRDVTSILASQGLSCN